MFRSLCFRSITFVCVMVLLASAIVVKVQAQENHGPQELLHPLPVRLAAQQPSAEFDASAVEAQKKKAKPKKAPEKKNPQVWEGDEDLAGYGALTFRLSADGKAVMIDAKETMDGTWSREGRTMILTFGGGNIIYTGTLDGKTLSGTAADNRHRWSFTVKGRLSR